MYLNNQVQNITVKTRNIFGKTDIKILEKLYDSKLVICLIYGSSNALPLVYRVS